MVLQWYQVKLTSDEATSPNLVPFFLITSHKFLPMRDGLPIYLFACFKTIRELMLPDKPGKQTLKSDSTSKKI